MHFDEVRGFWIAYPNSRECNIVSAPRVYRATRPRKRLGNIVPVGGTRQVGDSVFAATHDPCRPAEVIQSGCENDDFWLPLFALREGSEYDAIRVFGTYLPLCL